MLKVFKSSSGFAIIHSLILLTIAAILGGSLFKSISDSKNASLKNLDNDSIAMNIASAAETFTPALRLAESKYHEYINGCDAAVSFAEALFSGHNCPTAGNIDIFSADDVKTLDPPEQALFQYLGKWTIQNNKLSTPPQNAVVRIQLGTTPIAVEFYLDAVLPQKSWILMKAVVFKNNVEIYNRKIAFITNSQSYPIHVESSNSSITQEAQDPNNPCSAAEWQTFLTLKGGICTPLETTGGVTGITKFRNRYFGLRSYDGQIVDLTGTSIITNAVEEDGTLAGVPIFPPYKKNTFVGVDDIEVVGDDTDAPQIYFVRGSAPDVHINYIDPVTDTTFPVCNLGALGWSTSYSGFSATYGSERLIPTPPEIPSISTAHFILKSDTGDIFNVFVRSQKNGTTYSPGLPPEAIIVDPKVKRTFICSVYKLKIPPDPENTRTMGMTQSGSVRKRFNLL